MQRHLVEQARRGDRDAYEALASAAFDGLYGLAYRILRDTGRDDAFTELWVRSSVRTMVARCFGQLTAEDIYDASQRDKKAKEMLTELNAELARAEIAYRLGKRYAQDEPLDWGVSADAPAEDKTRLKEAGQSLRLWYRPAAKVSTNGK